MSQNTEHETYIPGVGWVKKPKTNTQKNSNPEIDSETKKQFNENINRVGNANGKVEQKFVEVQLFLESKLKHIKCYTDESGSRTLFSVNEQNIAKTENEDTIVNFVSPLAKHLNISNKALIEHFKTWRASLPFSPMPASFSLDPIEVTFNRITIALESGPTPTWDSFVGRCGLNGEALMAFIWSLLDKNDKSQQYVFLKGSGGDGKGSLTRWLDRLFNNQLVGLSASNKYWPADCVGKRVGVFSDLNNTSIVLSSQFKRITGNDKTSIENKWEKAYSITLDTKFILTTNRPVAIVNDDAMRRRTILVEVSHPDNTIEDYEENLELETSAFLFKCKQAYEKHYNPKTKEIKCDYTFFESEAASFEENHQATFDRFFYFNEKSYVDASQFHNILTKNRFDNNEIGNFKEWLERTYKIKRSQKTLNCVRQWVYFGIGARNP